MHSLEDTNEHFKEIILFPDYASTALWCTCGLGLGNPENVLEVPERLIKLAETWNSFWTLASNHNRSENNPFLPEIISMGEYIAEEFSKYIPCTLDKERCAL